MTLIPGPLLWVIYNKIIVTNPRLIAGLFGQRINLSIVIASFAFTMMGFLAAAITLLVSFSGSIAYNKYKRRGYLSVMLWFYFFSIICLIVTFVLALLCFSKIGSIALFQTMLMSAVNNLFQIALITLVIINMAGRVSDES